MIITYNEIKDHIDVNEKGEWVWRDTGEIVILRQHKYKDKVIVEFQKMKKYVKKPVVIEAAQWLGQSEVIAWVADNVTIEVSVDFRTEKPTLTIRIAKGDIIADFEDWIIKGVKGEFYPCRPDIFELTYEEVKDGLE